VPHGALHVEDYDIDGYAVSAYKVYSRHNYGVGWVSARIENLAHDRIEGTPDNYWELGTRDAAAYACLSEVVSYLGWLGAQFTNSDDRRQRLLAAGKAITEHENFLLDLLINGREQNKGLADMPAVSIIGGPDNEYREGVISLTVQHVDSADVVSELSEKGIRVHLRSNDQYSANVLEPLGLTSCIRVSIAHYNTADEVLHFLQTMASIVTT